MRNYPQDKYEQDELENLNAAPWQIELLKKNPDYTSWGNFEDYMSEDKGGWSSRVNLESWSEHWELDDLNEVVNFYFEVYRKNHACPHCEQTGYNPATKRLSDDWYDFEHTGRRWCDKINENEVMALAKSGRLHNFTKDRFHYDEEKGMWAIWNGTEKVFQQETPTLPTAAEVNAGEKRGGLGGHDAINRMICIRQRAKDLGVYGHCEYCEGQGYIYDEPTARVGLQLWYLLPRKGCSRGVYFENIEESELPEIFAYLKEAAQRNAERFGKL